MEYKFTKENLARIDELKTHYPPDQPRAPLLMVLHIVQDQFGYIPEPMIGEVAKVLDIPKIQVEEVVTFYPLFRWEHNGRRKFGKNHVGVCVTLSCEIGGCKQIVDHLEKKYGVHFDGVSADGRLSLQEMQCLGSCHTAPVVLFNDMRYENITPDQLDKLIQGGKR